MDRDLKRDALIYCPTCKKRFAYFSSEYRPFCTERCKMVDLGHWFDESYSVAGEPAMEDESYLPSEVVPEGYEE